MKYVKDLEGWLLIFLAGMGAIIMLYVIKHPGSNIFSDISSKSKKEFSDGPNNYRDDSWVVDENITTLVISVDKNGFNSYVAVDKDGHTRQINSSTFGRLINIKDIRVIK